MIWRFLSFIPPCSLPCHVGGGVQGNPEHGEGGEGGGGQCVSWEVVEPFCQKMNIYGFRQTIPIWDEPHVAWGVDRGWIRPRVGGWKEALRLPVTSLLGKLTNYFDAVLICTCLHLCEVESVKSWSRDWNQEEGVVPGAAQFFCHGQMMLDFQKKESKPLPNTFMLCY